MPDQVGLHMSRWGAGLGAAAGRMDGGRGSARCGGLGSPDDKLSTLPTRLAQRTDATRLHRLISKLHEPLRGEAFAGAPRRFLAGALGAIQSLDVGGQMDDGPPFIGDVCQYLAHHAPMTFAHKC